MPVSCHFQGTDRLLVIIFIKQPVFKVGLLNFVVSITAAAADVRKNYIAYREFRRDIRGFFPPCGLLDSSTV